MSLRLDNNYTSLRPDSHAANRGQRRRQDKPSRRLQLRWPRPLHRQLRLIQRRGHLQQQQQDRISKMQAKWVFETCLCNFDIYMNTCKHLHDIFGTFQMLNVAQFLSHLMAWKWDKTTTKVSLNQEYLHGCVNTWCESCPTWIYFLSSGFLTNKTFITAKVSSNHSLEGWDAIWNHPSRTLDSGIVMYQEGNLPMGGPPMDRFANTLFSYESRDHSMKWIQFDLKTQLSVTEVVMTLHHPWWVSQKDEFIMDDRSLYASCFILLIRS